MKTVITTSPDEAAGFIKRGGIVAFPTETVYGLGANIFDEKAVAKIFETKLRPADNPLIAHISEVRQIKELASEITEIAAKFISNFFPGPLTVVLHRSEKVPLIATAGLDTIGIRMPRLELARQFLSACETPVAAPSANISGRPSPTTWEAVLEDLDGRIDCILRSDPTEIGLESTVVDCTSKIPIVLRSGSVSLEQIRDIVPTVRFGEPGQSEAPRSPGMRHKHYSPRANVLVVDRSDRFTDCSRSAYIGLKSPLANVEYVRLCTDADEYARSIFEFFRECDRLGIETIYCEAVEESGIGLALMDRIRRAAEKSGSR